MRNVVLLFGSISGIIVSIFLLVGMYLWNQGLLTFDTGDLVGYAGMIIALSLVFFGIKSYRDKHLKGTIKFVQGLHVGLLISLIASLIYAGVWEVYYQTNEDVRNSFMDKYTEYCVMKMKKEGASESDIEKKVKEISDLKEMYKNPFMRFGITAMEILPVGILISFISAAVLRRRDVLP